MDQTQDDGHLKAKTTRRFTSKPAGFLKKISTTTGSTVAKHGQALKQLASELLDSDVATEKTDQTSHEEEPEEQPMPTKEVSSKSRFVRKVSGHVHSVSASALKHSSGTMLNVKKKVTVSKAKFPGSSSADKKVETLEASPGSASGIEDASKTVSRKSWSSKMMGSVTEKVQSVLQDVKQEVQDAVVDTLIEECVGIDTGVEGSDGDLDDIDNKFDGSDNDNLEDNGRLHASDNDNQVGSGGRLHGNGGMITETDRNGASAASNYDGCDDNARSVTCGDLSEDDMLSQGGTDQEQGNTDQQVQESAERGNIDQDDDDESKESVSSCCAACNKKTKRSRLKVLQKSYLKCSVCGVSVCDRAECLDGAFGEFPRPQGSRCIGCRDKPISAQTRLRALPVVPRSLRPSQVFVNGVPQTLLSTDILRSEATMFQLHGQISCGASEGEQSRTVHIWYDRKTGIVGEIGQDPCTSISAGLHLGGGEMHRWCSRGATSTTLNGRELSLEELAEWKKVDNISFAFGTDYWMTHNGEFGVVGEEAAKSSIWRQRLATGKKLTNEAAKIGVAGLLTGGVGAVLATPGLFACFAEGSAKDKRRRPILLDREGKPLQKVSMQRKLTKAATTKGSKVFKRKSLRKARSSHDEESNSKEDSKPSPLEELNMATLEVNPLEEDWDLNAECFDDGIGEWDQAVFDLCGGSEGGSMFSQFMDGGLDLCLDVLDLAADVL